MIQVMNEGWQLRMEGLDCGASEHAVVSRAIEGWMSVQLPCDVHVPLIREGIIPDPVLADYSFQSEWTEKKSWWFRKLFHARDVLDCSQVELTIESIDARADVFLNGIWLGTHESAFYPFRREVSGLLNDGENELLVRVTPGVEHLDEVAASSLVDSVTIYKEVGRGDPRRVHVRKPQYVFGWDWGPRAVTCGIMGSVTLQGLQAVEVRNVRAWTKSVTPQALIGIEAELENTSPLSTAEVEVTVEIRQEQEVVYSVRLRHALRSGINFITQECVIPNAALWWPNGMGEQPLYTLTVYAEAAAAEESVKAVSAKSAMLGIRTVELCQTPLNADERKFGFVVNGVEVFAKGANWIPADSLYARVTPEKISCLIEEAREANFNMLRIWGGGIYEQGRFYEECDRLGIMVWQDFMFACGKYPDDDDAFVGLVRNEIEYQLRRLGSHPCIVLWCGNNENHWGLDKWWPKSKSTAGLRIYNELAPRLVRQLLPEALYWNSSPYGGTEPNGNLAGDKHHWGECMMNPEMEKRITPEEYDKVTAKFVSEYGYVGPCRKSTIERYMDGAPIDPGSRIWQLHNNTFEKDTVRAGIAKQYIDSESLSLDDYLLYAGLCQGLMLGYSLEALRANLSCDGGLFWMYNDCWGEVGWSIIDYELRRKISFYDVRRALAPVSLILRSGDEGLIRIVAVNETANDIESWMEYGYCSFDGTRKRTERVAVTLKARTRQELLRFSKYGEDERSGCYFARMSDRQDVAAALLRSMEYRNLNMPTATVVVEEAVRIETGWKLTVAADTYAHKVHFPDTGDDSRWSDEYFDLLPGERRTVELTQSRDVPDSCPLPSWVNQLR